MITRRTDYSKIYSRHASTKNKKHLWMPRFTVNNLTDELDYYLPHTLILFAHGTGVEVHRDLVVGLLHEAGHYGESTAMVLLSIPRPGIGVLTLNPGYRSRRKAVGR